jgi:hypothetical protein
MPDVAITPRLVDQDKSGRKVEVGKFRGGKIML